MSNKCISNISCPDWIQHIPFDIYFYVLQKKRKDLLSQKVKNMHRNTTVKYYKFNTFTGEALQVAKKKRNTPNRDLSII